MKARWPRHVILRSGLLFGPAPAFPVKHALLLQGMDKALAAKVR